MIVRNDFEGVFMLGIVELVMNGGYVTILLLAG